MSQVRCLFSNYNRYTMRYFLYSWLMFSLAGRLMAQPVIAGFDEIEIPAAGYLNNAGPAGAFVSQQLALPNQYNSQFDFWSGWAISRITDNQTAGFGNQYSVISGSGAEGSANYAVGYCFDPIIVRLTGTQAGSTVEGLSVNNSTYTYFSMRDGDAFSKRFGGVSGNDPDYLLLSIRAYYQGLLSPDSATIYLADYRFADNQLDYILDEWTFVDLSALGNADSLQFRLTSTDIGVFGMNTPAYFCIDNVRLSPLSTTETLSASAPIAKVWPNPAAHELYIDTPEAGVLLLWNSSGQLLRQQQIVSPLTTLDISLLPTGNYRLQSVSAVGSRIGTFIKW